MRCIHVSLILSMCWSNWPFTFPLPCKCHPCLLRMLSKTLRFYFGQKEAQMWLYLDFVILFKHPILLGPIHGPKNICPIHGPNTSPIHGPNTNPIHGPNTNPMHGPNISPNKVQINPTLLFTKFTRLRRRKILYNLFSKSQSSSIFLAQSFEAGWFSSFPPPWTWHVLIFEWFSMTTTFVYLLFSSWIKYQSTIDMKEIWDNFLY